MMRILLIAVLLLGGCAIKPQQQQKYEYIFAGVGGGRNIWIKVAK